ncbi:MAG: M1 family metallopeptidase [Saprospiraceae bacterium]
MINTIRLSSLIAILLFSMSVFSQSDRWQQHVEYEMEIDFDVKKHQYKGKQKVNYTNNSPDILNKIFYHLYLNAFQPNSMMDMRSRLILDPDRRVGDRISKLKPNEIGYHKVLSLKQDGQDLKYHIEGTILEVTLAKSIGLGETVSLEMEFESQIPVQIRRNGRDNAEGVDYSMAQWYPKLCEYDYQGWHANPYIAREFYGVWGDFDVKINIHKKYTLGASGVLQNADNIGRGYSDRKRAKAKKGKIQWHFKAENVHDFVWAADRDFQVDSKVFHDGTKVYFVYIPGEKTTDNWKAMPNILDEALNYMNSHFGKYPYPVYSFIQGGDGGMEYPMATLITGERSIGSLIGVSVHEWMHSWYQMILGTNESLYSWMDEGFTSWGSAATMNYLRKKKLVPGDYVADPHIRSVAGYVRFANTGNDQALSTHSDHFKTNQAYGTAAYTKGAACLTQLQYIMGKEPFEIALLKYFNTWKFKHPNANDFFRIMELESGLELDWFKEYFVYSRDMADYAVGDVLTKDGKTRIDILKLEQMPMPLDVTVTFEDGTSQLFYIPIRLMRGEKQFASSVKVSVLEDWPWTNPSYSFEVDKTVQSIHIDATGHMMDRNRENNVWNK